MKKVLSGVYSSSISVTACLFWKVLLILLLCFPVRKTDVITVMFIILPKDILELLGEM